MKISLSTIRGLNKRYGCADDIAPDGIDALIAKIGAQLAAVESVTEIDKKYQGVTVAKIVSCEPHPNADKLKVCTIDDGGNTPSVNRGDDGHIQVVCAAPNAKAGLIVAWLPPGSTVPDTYEKEPFILEARDLRGVVSNGMLASAKELALGDSHEGILEIEEEIKPGTSFAEYYGLAGDYIIELENKMFTHRPDCFGFLGISRELAGIQHMPFKSPDWYVTKQEFPVVETDDLPLEVVNEIPELVQRFAAITMSNVTIKSSPVWLQVELAKVGLRPINNIVDYTNFFMLETGQPLHAYDYDKVAALSNNQAKLVIRKPKEGEKVQLLNGKEIEPYADAILIATDQQPIGIGGVMGGSDTEVDSNTKNIILECANFDMYTIRRTAMANGLFTDAVTRFNKGQSPLQNLAVLAKIVDEIQKFADGKVAGPVIDINHLTAEVSERGSVYSPVRVTVDFMNARLGLDLPAAEMSKLLNNVEFTVSEDNTGDTAMKVQAPFWRTDIEIPEDIVEEIGRLHGYDHIPLELPVRDLTPVLPDVLVSLKSKIRQTLAKAGANELLTYSFVHGNLLDKTGQDHTKAFELSNAISPDLQYYRMSLTPSLLDKVHSNIKAGHDEFAIYEIGKVHMKGEVDADDPAVPKEVNALSLVFACDNKLAKKKYAGAAYYQAKKYLAVLLEDFPGLVPTVVDFEPLAGADLYNNPWLEQKVAMFEPVRSSLLRDKQGLVWGVVGEYKFSVNRALKLPAFTAGFELDPLLFLQTTSVSKYVSLSRFPSVSQDISLKVPASLAYAELFNFVDQNLVLPESTYYKLEAVDIYQREQEPDYKQVTLRLSIASYIKTLTDTEVNKMLDDVSIKAHTQFGAERL